MQRREQVVRLGRHDGERLDRPLVGVALACPELREAGLSGRRLPALEEPRQREGSLVLEGDPVGALAVAQIGPLVEAITGDETAPGLVGRSETPLVGDGFGPRVDQPVFLVGPRGRQPPLEALDSVGRLVGDDRQPLAGCAVVPRLQRLVWLGLEPIDERLGGRTEGVAAAHTATSWPTCLGDSPRRRTASTASALPTRLAPRREL